MYDAMLDDETLPPPEVLQRWALEAATLGDVPDYDDDFDRFLESDFGAAPPTASFDVATRTWFSPSLHELPDDITDEELIDDIAVGARQIAAIQANQVLALARLLAHREHAWLTALAEAADHAERDLCYASEFVQHFGEINTNQVRCA